MAENKLPPEKKVKNKKINAPKVAMAVAFLLAVSKAGVGFFTGSLAVLSSAVDSILDILASFFNFMAIKKAEEPADMDHQFGHGKYESLAAFIQSLIILASGLWILVSAWKRFGKGAAGEVGPESVWIMVFSVIATILLTLYLKRTAKREKSAVIEADAMHYSVDLYTNVGILAALVVMRSTGWTFIDPLVAALVAVYIMFSAVRLSYRVSRDLLDSRVEADIYKKLLDVLNDYDFFHKDFHRLRTRTSGQEKFIDMHMTLCSKLTLSEVHKITDAIEEAIRKEIPEADVTIHPEPCGHEDHDCDDEKDCNSIRVRQGLESLAKRAGVKKKDWPRP